MRQSVIHFSPEAKPLNKVAKEKTSTISPRQRRVIDSCIHQPYQRTSNETTLDLSGACACLVHWCFRIHCASPCNSELLNDHQRTISGQSLLVLWQHLRLQQLRPGGLGQSGYQCQISYGTQQFQSQLLRVCIGFGLQRLLWWHRSWLGSMRYDQFQ